MYNQKIVLSLISSIVIGSIVSTNGEVDSDTHSNSNNNALHNSHVLNHTFSEKAGVLRVLDLNTWGLGWPFSLDCEERFSALREIIAHSNYDVILLQEVWYRQDHELLRAAMPYSTYFGLFNSRCSGYLLPLGCSGLTILSRHPFEAVEFTPFSVRGSFWSFDGEIFVQKGLGRARIRWNDLAVDLFTTHLVSYTNNPNRDNNHYRYMQTLETVKYIEASDADVKIFAGDVNALPLTGSRQPYGLLTSLMTDSLVDRYPNESWHPWFATFGNHHNTYTREDAPERIDYLMYWSKPDIRMCTSKFTMPMYQTKNRQGQVVSLSDHEALQADFLIERKSNYDYYSSNYSNYADNLNDNDNSDKSFHKSGSVEENYYYDEDKVMSYLFAAEDK